MISKNASDWGVKLLSGLNDQSIWLNVSKGSSPNKEIKQSTKFSDRSDLLAFYSFLHAWYSFVVKELLEEKKKCQSEFFFFNVSSWVFRNFGLCEFTAWLDGVDKWYWFFQLRTVHTTYIFERVNEKKIDETRWLVSLPLLCSCL